jgi:hypothetical protein
MENELNPIKINTEIHAAKEQEKKFNHLGSGRKPFKNAKLFEMDIITFVVTEIELECKKELVLEKLNGKIDNKEKFKAFINPSNVHIWALNKQSCLKKLKKDMNLLQKLKLIEANFG